MTKLARELTAYGSDIVVEEDLAAIFGRLRISSHFERSFRAGVGPTERTVLSFIPDIVLESGPGRTVQRAPTANPEDHRYLSTVIQLSLLSNVHEIDSLAEWLSDILRRRLEGAPADHSSAPGYDALFGVLRACREQTNNFQWQFLLDSVQGALGKQYSASCLAAYRARMSYNDLLARGEAWAPSPPILQGLLDMIVAAQGLPEDRTIHIHTLQEIPIIVVWAHHILGLSVLVILNAPGRASTETDFGHSQPHVIIDASHSMQLSENSICLLSPREEGDVLFSLEDDTQLGQRLEASSRRPLGGFGRAFVESRLELQAIRLDSEEIQALRREIALDVICLGIDRFYTLGAGSCGLAFLKEQCCTPEVFDTALKNSPYGSWSQVEAALEVLFEQSFRGSRAQVLSYAISQRPLLDTLRLTWRGHASDGYWTTSSSSSHVELR